MMSLRLFGDEEPWSPHVVSVCQHESLVMTSPQDSLDSDDGPPRNDDYFIEV